MTTAIYEDDGQLLGKGSLGEVIKVKEGDQQYALKKIPKMLIKRHGRLKQLNREVALMKKIKHQNIVKIVQYSETEQFHQIKMQFCKGKNLKQFLLSDTFKKLMESNTPNYYPIKIALDLINALAKIRSMLISNRDIKHENIIVNLTPDGKIQAKMIDFGEAKFHVNMAVSRVGTNGYMAPEVFFQGNYNQSCDDWSLGWVLYQLFNHPFQKNGTLKQLICPFKQNFKPKTQQDFYKLYSQLIIEPLSLQFKRNPQPFRSIIRNFLRKQPDERLKLQIAIQYLLKQFQNVSMYLPQSDRKKQLQKLNQSLFQLKRSSLIRQSLKIQIEVLRIGFLRIILVIMKRVTFQQIMQSFQFIKFFMSVFQRINKAAFLIGRDLQVSNQYIYSQIASQFASLKQIQKANSLYRRINNNLLRDRIILQKYTFDKKQVKNFLIKKKITQDQIGVILANMCIITFQDK